MNHSENYVIVRICKPTSISYNDVASVIKTNAEHCSITDNYC
jgi:hypothetical protein